MSEIKPVYQAKKLDEIAWADVTFESYKDCLLAQTILETRILYPAAAYEALQKENAEWKTVLDCNEQIRVAQANRIADLEETNGLLQTQVHCLEIVAASKNGDKP